MPWEEALFFVVDTLKQYKLKNEIKVITATRIFTAFDIFIALCIGADICNSARAMMLASGCGSLEEMNRGLVCKKVDENWLSYAEEYEPKIN